MRTITITAYRRPECFEQLLQSLLTNDLTGWEIWVFVEPSSRAEEFNQLCKKMLEGRDWHLIFNPKVLGVRHNPYQALCHVFSTQGAGLNIYLEEDFLVAPDLTNLASWYAENNHASEMCLNLVAGGCLSRGLLSYDERPEVLVETRQFNSLGFVATAQQWRQHFEPNWFRVFWGMFAHNGWHLSGWDCSMYAHLMTTPSLRVMQPLSARVVHNGREKGENCGEQFHDETFSGMYLYSGKSGELQYQKCDDWQELPQAIRAHLYLWKEIVDQQLVGRRLSRPFLFLILPVYLLRNKLHWWMRQVR